MKPQIQFDSAKVGDKFSLAPVTVTRKTLALYAGASGDHHPVHIDIDAARAAGFDDVFAHGMLSMAYLGRLLTDLVPQRQLRHFGVRFTSMTPIGAEVVCSGEIVEKNDEHRRLTLNLTATDQRTGEVRLAGSAVVQF